MKLSKMRPDWAETQNSLDPQAVRAAQDHTQPQGASPAVPADQPYELDPRPPHPDPSEFKVRPMTQEECIEFANLGIVKYLSTRIVELNESIAQLGDVGSNDTLDEREVAMLIIQELMRARSNVPGYTDPTHSQTSNI